VGYVLARLTDGDVLSLAIGFVVVGSLMAISYWHKVRADGSAGATTEVSGLLTYLIGALVHAQAYWLAVAIGVVAVLLLELGQALERLSSRVNRDEVTAFAKFLVLAAVILPVLPDRPFTPFAIDPFRTWLVIVAVSGVSYVGYVAQRAFEERGGVLLTALLGGAYSSTITTIVLARRAKGSATPRLYAGCMLAASGVMYPGDRPRRPRGPLRPRGPDGAERRRPLRARPRPSVVRPRRWAHASGRRSASSVAMNSSTFTGFVR
jgi:uncharacterized membrane protein (DUF4010 family)